MPAGLHPTRSATLLAGRDRIGVVGEIAPDVLDAFGIDERVAVLELNLSIVLADRAEAGPLEGDEPPPVERPRPGVRARRRSCRPRSSTRRSARAPATCSSASNCSTCYRGANVPNGSRSLAYRLRLQAPDRTLSDADTAAVVAAVKPPRRSSAPRCGLTGTAPSGSGVEPATGTVDGVLR